MQSLRAEREDAFSPEGTDETEGAVDRNRQCADSGVKLSTQGQMACIFLFLFHVFKLFFLRNEQRLLKFT